MTLILTNNLIIIYQLVLNINRNLKIKASKAILIIIIIQHRINKKK